MPSVSSLFMTAITQFRNPNENTNAHLEAKTAEPSPGRRICAEIAYVIVIPIALVEAAFSAIIKLLSLCLPLSKERYDLLTNWISSSGFSIAWSIVYLFANLIKKNLICLEIDARIATYNALGKLLNVPQCR